MRLVYGINPVLEALRAGSRVGRVLVASGAQSPALSRVELAAKEAHVAVSRLSVEELTRRATGGVHQGVIAEVESIAYVEVADLLDAAKRAGQPPFIAVLDSIVDPQNLGALIRSAHALGAHGMVIPKDRAAEVTPSAEKASAGAVSYLPLARVVNLSRAIDELKEAGVWTCALAADGETELAQVDFREPSAIVIGSEGKGVRPLVRKTCDRAARIPMAGRVGSLNASVAGAIAFYEVARQRSS